MLHRIPKGTRGEGGSESRRRRHARRMLALLVVACVAGGGAVPATAQDDADTTTQICRRAVEGARVQYQNRDFDDAIQLVSACLNQDDVPDEWAVESYRLLALCYVRQDRLDEARVAVLNLLGVDPDFTPDAVADPPPFVSLVTVVKRDLERRASETASAETRPSRPTPFFRRTGTWLVIGGGLLVGGALSVVSLAGGNGDSGEPPPTGASDLPLPPPDPD